MRTLSLCMRRLNDHNRLFVILDQLRHCLFQIRESAVPEWIIGKSDQVKILESCLKGTVKPLFQIDLPSALVEMDHNLHLIFSGCSPRTADSGIYKLYHFCIIRQLSVRKQKAASDLISDLNNIRQNVLLF